MIALCVDDEHIPLGMLKKSVEASEEISKVYAFEDEEEALECAASHSIDVAFLDIELRIMNGIELARKLQELQPGIAVIFCTSYEQYAIETIGLHMDAGYLVKPIRPVQVQNEISYIAAKKRKERRIRAKCFGEFEVYADDKPMEFPSPQIRELFAYLIDKRGVLVSADRICEVLCTEDLTLEEKKNRFYPCIGKLKESLTEAGFGEVLRDRPQGYAVNVRYIDCDYYRMLDDDDPVKERYTGEYMRQYVWAEETNAWLLRNYTGLSSGGMLQEAASGEERSLLQGSGQEWKEGTLTVRLLGDFSVVWQGRELIDARQKGSQFCGLLETMFFYHKEGAPREALREMLFEERDVEDIQHAMRTVIYNSKRRLREAGFPDENYISVQQGVYYWTDRLPVNTDTEAFTGLCEKAEKETNDEKKLSLLLCACHVYRGPFLNQTSLALWAMQEARRFRTDFRNCVEQAAVLLRKKNEYNELKELGEYAAKTDPFAEWEALVVEALIKLGRRAEAEDYSKETAEKYIRENGEKNGENIHLLMERMSEYLILGNDDPEEIKKELAGKAGSRKGGFVCSYYTFREVYRILLKTLGKTGGKAYLMICSFADRKGKPAKDSQAAEESSKKLLEVITESTLPSDTITRYGEGYYLILCADRSEQNCTELEQSIKSRFSEEEPDRPADARKANLTISILKI